MKPRTKLEADCQFFYQDSRALQKKDRRYRRFIKREMRRARRRFNKFEAFVRDNL